MSKFVPTVVFDFDGVIHSYKSGWQGATVIPDEPVPGIAEAIAAVRMAGFRAVVVSTRCATMEGIVAVEDYLEKNGITVDGVQMEKPPAICYVDDRAICFDGDAASLVRKILEFKPWTEKAPATKTISTADYRPCVIDGVKALFHRWEEVSEIVYPSLMKGGHPGGEMKGTLAIVEMEDGSVRRVAPDAVRFTDNAKLFDLYCMGNFENA